MEGVLLLILALVLYLLPALIAGHRKHQSNTAITVLNLFLGWTGIAWLFALIWSLTGVWERPAAPPAVGLDDTKACPACAETIKAAAKVCRYCGHEQPAATLPVAAPDHQGY